MSLPKMTDDQHTMAVILLANAIRAGTLARQRLAESSNGNLAARAIARWRAEAANRYAEGMRDLLAVLFEGGRPLADACFEEARRLQSSSAPFPADD